MKCHHYPICRGDVEYHLLLDDDALQHLAALCDIFFFFLNSTGVHQRGDIGYLWSPH